MEKTTISYTPKGHKKLFILYRFEYYKNRKATLY